MSETVFSRINLANTIVELVQQPSSLFNKTSVEGKTTSSATLTRPVGTNNRWQLKVLMNLDIPLGSEILDYSLTTRQRNTIFTTTNIFGFCTTEASLITTRNFAWSFNTFTTFQEVTRNEISHAPTVGTVFNSTWGNTLLGDTANIWNNIGMFFDFTAPGASTESVLISWMEAIVTYNPPKGGAMIFLGSQF